MLDGLCCVQAPYNAAALWSVPPQLRPLAMSAQVNLVAPLPRCRVRTTRSLRASEVTAPLVQQAANARQTDSEQQHCGIWGIMSLHLACLQPRINEGDETSDNGKGVVQVVVIHLLGDVPAVPLLGWLQDHVHNWRYVAPHQHCSYPSAHCSTPACMLPQAGEVTLEALMHPCVGHAYRPVCKNLELWPHISKCRR